MDKDRKTKKIIDWKTPRTGEIVEPENGWIDVVWHNQEPERILTRVINSELWYGKKRYEIVEIEH